MDCLQRHLSRDRWTVPSCQVLQQLLGVEHRTLFPHVHHVAGVMLVAPSGNDLVAGYRISDQGMQQMSKTWAHVIDIC